jgi:beta-mannosidase
MMKQFLLFLMVAFPTVELSNAQIKALKLENPYYISPRKGNQHIDLSKGWQLSYSDSAVSDVSSLPGKSAVNVENPTSVHMALCKAGKLPHPYANLNSTLYRWVEEKVWYYSKSVLIPTSAKGQILFLSFDGVDYFSKVWVNGKIVGYHEGMFGGPTIDISSLVRYNDNNEIVIEVRAANWGNKATDFEKLPLNAQGKRDISKRTGYEPQASGKIIKPWVISGSVGTEAFFSLGMWQGARIEIIPVFHIERPFLKTLSATPDNAVLHISAEIFANANSLQQQLHHWTSIYIGMNNPLINYPKEQTRPFIPVNEKLNVIIELFSDNVKVFTKEFPLDLYQGRNWLEQDLNIPNPKLWDPGGLGKPDLYNVQLSLKKNETIIDKIEFDYGIRTIERVASAGPRTADRWENWQFIVNGKRIFVKGMNWTPIDVLLDMPVERYRWALNAAKNMGVQLIRIWGGGLLEKDCFYKICNELGMMVWQDFPIGNMETPDYPQDVWEEEVVQNIFRLRNHPSLVVWCGGNEFNPYSYGNAATIGILERNLKIFDNTRLFVRTSPDNGSMHVYPDIDPSLYNRLYKYEPWVAETGIHCIPEAGVFFELVDNKEFIGFGKMWDKSFGPKHPEFIHHFTEFDPDRVPRMLSRASHIDNMANPTIESLSEATQIGAAEWYQIVSEKMQGNYPVTTGLLPWVFKRHWPVVAIQMLDWFGQPVAPYYFLKRTYEPTHIALDLPRLLWKSGETIDLKAKITNASVPVSRAKVSISVFDDHFKQLSGEETITDIKSGTSVTELKLRDFPIPENYKDRFLFLLTELRDASGKLISRSVYFPRILTIMDDPAFYTKYFTEPIPWINLDKGPWLKPAVALSPTKMEAKLISKKPSFDTTYAIEVKVKNNGKVPAFMTRIDIEGAKRIFYASDNYFWLAPGEEKMIEITLSFRENTMGKNIVIKTGSWNAKTITVQIPKEENQ